MEAIVFRREAGHGILEERSIRSLRAAGIERIASVDFTGLGERLRGVSQAILLIRAGAWFVCDTPLPAIPSSATGRPLIGLGASRVAAGLARSEFGEAREWASLLKKCGGDLARRGWWQRSLPCPSCVFLEARAARACGESMAGGVPFARALQALVRSRRFRAIHLPALDSYFDPGLRVVQLVTTIQIGGAERVTLDLAEELPRQGVSVCVAAFGKPTRLAFPEPANFADLSEIPHEPERRAEAVARLCRDFGADLVHAHLIRAREAQAIRAQGLPLAITIHNMPQSWPAGLATAGDDVADLLLPCSEAVAAAVRAHLPSVPARTVWNGIDPATVAPTAERRILGEKLRAQLNYGAGDFVLVAIANPRRQKRLDRLPEILCYLQKTLGPDRPVRLLLAGAPAGGNRDAEEAVEALETEITRWQMEDSICWTGPVLEIAPILAASHALISVSEFEGLSLAHLEALAAGLPVVATDVGGTREVAAQTPLLRLVPPDTDAIVAELASIARSPGQGRESTLPKSFTRYHMARRCAFLYPRIIERHRARTSNRDREGLWLITNNFSTGGAQSSARRLLLGLQARGIKVRAAVVQEEVRHPTPGRRALLEAGLQVVAVPPPSSLDAEEAVREILTHLAEDPPHAVVFWNLIASYKVLLADGLFDTAVFDVSPGEMYFRSLDEYFANPRPGLPYRIVADYGRRLSGVVVKYWAEGERARQALGVPAHVIPNGVPLPPAHPLKEKSRLTFGTAARIAPHKRLEDLLAAFRLALPHLPPCILRIAGGVEAGADDYARTLRRLARGMPVEWCGELSGTGDFLGTLDVFLMVSEPAGCPNASLEAMAAGLPVVATDVGGASEQVVHGQTGLLVPRWDDQAFADAIVKLAADLSLRRRMGNAARTHVAANFSLERMIARYAEVFNLLPESAEGMPSATAASRGLLIGAGT